MLVSDDSIESFRLRSDSRATSPLPLHTSPYHSSPLAFAPVLCLPRRLSLRCTSSLVLRHLRQR
ncbi:hypothetical protein GQ607_000481 [Colletotrichum asianum]|uniref:Uncharacterized protein n=1 Tax=Colletotrichum asianum TaxID=702518 RepID=A0A8H3WSU6_9PEZI|nr:hypothetical protein GQ607_000481 [Colletotrichum asianum]